MLFSESTPLLITVGEPAGIGPELVVRTLGTFTGSNQVHEKLRRPSLVVADAGLIQRAASHLGFSRSSIDTSIRVFETFSEYSNRTILENQLDILHVPMAVPEIVGTLDVRNGAYVLDTLKIATRLCLSNEAAGLVTGPLHKGVINDSLAGESTFFSGHTEYLAELSVTPRVVMMLATEGLRVALVTTHLSLKDVSAAVTRESVSETLEILEHEMVSKFGIDKPRITVCGLNPHAGEGGHLGMEEIEIIEPVIQRCREQGMNIIGPLPADSAFTPDKIQHSDVILAMYHDQGLPVLKHAGFGNAINITLGLPFIRTSVDHGTALDIAGQGKANTSSLRLALRTAHRMAADSGKI